MNLFKALPALAFFYATLSFAMIVPPNDVKVFVGDKNTNGMTQVEFNRVIDSVEKVYAPIVKGLGGVIGKGVFLDGKNDFIDTGFPNPKNNDWYFGIWLDPRDISSSQVSTLYYFPDGSWIGLNRDKIVVHSSRHGSSGTQEFRLGSVPFSYRSYAHLGIKIYTKNGYRYLEFYKNGTKVVDSSGKRSLRYYIANKADMKQGFQLQIDYMKGWSWFVIGDPGPTHATANYTGTRKPFYGWVDEFRAYALNGNGKQSFFNEFICNLALGSLVKVDHDDEENMFRPLLHLAYKHKLLKRPPTPVDYDTHAYMDQGPGGRSIASVRRAIAPAPSIKPSALICEQLYIRSHKAPSDFPDQKGKTLCAAFAHKNSNPLLNTQALKDKCYRKTMLQVHNKKIEAGKPRPDFVTNQFCLSCHHDESAFMPMHVDALLYNNGINREHDPRRQPLDHPKFINGCLPARTPFTYQNDTNRCANNNFQMDYLLDFTRKTE